MAPVIKFNSKIYPQKAIEKACSEYQDMMACSLKKKGSYFIVSARNKTSESDELMRHEFCNHVLSKVQG